MVGSALVGAWIAHVAFWCLLVWGLMTGELGRRGAVIAVVLWLAGYIGLSFVPIGLFPSFVAVLDIGLVFVIFKGDVRLT